MRPTPQALAGLYMFRSVNNSSLEAFCQQASLVSFDPDQKAFRQGERADHALLIVTGQLEARIGPGGKRRVIGVNRPGDVVGETGLYVRGRRRSADVVATQPTTCVVLSRDLMDCASTNQAVVMIEQYLLSTIARRIRRQDQDVQRIWRENPTPTEDAPAPTLRERLRSFFSRS